MLRLSLGLLDQKQNNTHEQLINVQAFRAATNKVESPKRRNGLRRKSLSFNDALIDHNVKASEKCLISRTYVQVFNFGALCSCSKGEVPFTFVCRGVPVREDTYPGLSALSSSPFSPQCCH